MTSGHEHPQDPPDALPAALTRAQDDLAAYIRARVSPDAALLKIMEASDSDSAGPASIRSASAPRADSEHALAVIRIRGLARALDRDLTRASASDRASARDLARALASARALGRASASGRYRASARDLTRDLVRDVERACYLARNPDVSLELTRDRARDLARVRARARERASAINRAIGGAFRNLRLIGQLTAVPVDVSGADLSSEDFDDLDVLEDVIWTQETIWPPGVAERLLRRSREIRPGVYQVRGHGERDPLSLVTV